MAEKEEKSASIPWLPLITLIGVGSGVLLFFPQLISSRPGGGDPRLAGNTFDDQTIDARLWQDPLGVAIAGREKEQKQSPAHSVGLFQELLIHKCFPESPLCPLAKAIAEQANRIEIFAVMIPGGPYVEDVERRLRSRRAVIEGLGKAGYDPEKDHEIGYFWAPWPPLEPNVAACVAELQMNRNQGERSGIPIVSKIRPTRNNWEEPGIHSLLVPYEWCEPRTFEAGKPIPHILVLWLADDAFRDAPLARLADLISWFRLKFYDYGLVDSVPLPVFNVLGPDNSGTLHKMVLEAKDDPWNDDTRQCLTTTHVYSSQAAAGDPQLLSEIGPMDGPRICKNLIEQKVKRLQSGSGFFFERTILLDNQIVDTLRQELKLRGVKSDDEIAIISEEDTYYARALCSTFSSIFNPSHPPNIPNIYSFKYLRGIDGKLPSDEKDEKGTKDVAEGGSNNKQSSLRPSEQTEGLNQADDIRRLANMLRTLDADLRKRKNGGFKAVGGLKAVGLLGSDVYDKLELLKALRPMLPQAVFFTNNLDARLGHPDEWKETHNLVVVSAHDLSLKDGQRRVVQEVAPFRDSGQTALYEATLEAMGQPGIEDTKPKSPLIFEIGRNGPIELRIPEPESETTASIFRLLIGIGCFVGFGWLLLAWISFLSRATFAPSKAKGQVKQHAIASLSHVSRQIHAITALSWLSVPICAILAIGAVYWFYVSGMYSGGGESVAWFDGISAWPSIAIVFFAAFLAIHFISKTQFDLVKNAAKLAGEFGLSGAVSNKPHKIEDKIDIIALWQGYLCRGQFWRRLVRTVPMFVFYMAALASLLSLVGDFANPSIRGLFPFQILLVVTVFLFIFLTFFVIDAILLHEAFLRQLEKKDTHWPDATFEKFKYSIKSGRPDIETDLADYWDVLLIAKRTEAIGNLIYYPFIILSLLIVSRLTYFYDWVWSPALIVALSLHFTLVLYAAWRLPEVARGYRKKILERLERRKRLGFVDEQKKANAIDTVIEEVRSTHQGAYSYLWEQPAIRALILPSSVGFATLLQYLSH